MNLEGRKIALASGSFVNGLAFATAFTMPLTVFFIGVVWGLGLSKEIMARTFIGSIVVGFFMGIMIWTIME